MPTITRTTYESVKKFDRQQSEKFCTDLYKFDYEDGRENEPSIALAMVHTAIVGIKGIGPKELEEIKTQFESLFKKEQG